MCFLMALPIGFSILNSTLLRKFKGGTFKTKGDEFLFNGALSCVWIFVMLLWILISGDSAYSHEGVFYGAVLGAILYLFLYLRMKALSLGPVSLTTFIECSAFVIATLFGVVYASEKVNVFQIIGIGINILSLFMCINPRKSGEKLAGKWLLYCIGAMLANSMVGILYKLFGNCAAAGEANTMLLTAAVVSAILFSVTGYGINAISRTEKPSIHKNSLIYVVLCGIAGCMGVRVNIPLARIIPSVVLFPVVNGSVVLLSTLTGHILFKEKFSKIQKYGVITGLISIIVTGCGEALWNILC